MLEARGMCFRLLSRRRIVALAGLSCFVFMQPRLARAQAEELPPELAAEQNASSQARPSQVSSQAVGTPQPASTALPAPNPRPTILFLPYVGITFPVSNGSAASNTSPRFGFLLGWHATDRLSLNAECSVDYARPEPGLLLNGEEPNTRLGLWDRFWSPSSRYIDLTVSPLLSLHAGQIRLGPKVGWFTSKVSGGGGVPTTGSGLVAGFNVGLFLPYRSVSVGGLLTGSFRFFTSANEPSGAHHTVGLLAAVLL